MWLEEKGAAAKRTHPYKKPQEGQEGGAQTGSRAARLLAAPADKPIIKPHRMLELRIFDRTSGDNSTQTRLFFLSPPPFFSFIVLISQNTTHPSSPPYLSPARYTSCPPPPPPHTQTQWSETQ